MAYSFQKEYKLRQWTPLIHFQHDQAGATLRATEVKPKLDRFLAKQAKAQGNPLNKEWFINGEDGALDYKMQISIDPQATGKKIILDSEKEEDKNRYSIFYANTGDENKNKFQGIDEQIIKIKIVSFNHPDLLNHIDKNIEVFFIVTNFGHMQGKGFGSYTITEKNGQPVKSIENTSQDEIAQILMRYHKVNSCMVFDDISKENIFNAIKVVYDIIKSGTRYENMQPSLLFAFLNEKMKINVNNEKSFVYGKRIVTDIRNKPPKEENYDPGRQSRYVRAMLGVGERMEFIKDKDNPEKKTVIKIESNSDEIERYNSPIVFKIIGNSIYLVLRKINKKIFDKEFKFIPEEGDSFVLRTLSWSDMCKFQSDQFLIYVEGKLKGKQSKKKKKTLLQSYDATKNAKCKIIGRKNQ